MNFKELNIPGVFKIELEQKRDDRGFFMRMYDRELFEQNNLTTNWVQESMAFTKEKGTIRGLHFLYPPKNEAKLITMVSGEGFWVFIDIRKNSPTLGKWDSVTLSAETPSSLYLPRGFANGLCSLTDNCLVTYHMDNPYEDSAKSEFKWDDPTLNISWPIKKPTVLSERDTHAQSFKEFLETSGGGLDVA